MWALVLLSLFLIDVGPLWAADSSFPLDEKLRLARIEWMRTQADLAVVEKKWEAKFPEITRVVCEEGPARTSMLREIQRCETCSKHPNTSALLAGGKNCMAIGAENWRKILEVFDPPLGPTLGRASRLTSDAQAQERMRALMLSRRDFRDQIIDHQSAQRKFEHLQAIKDISSCEGRFVSKINLDAQFPPTHDQGDLGTCYAHTATGAAEAALFRNEGKRVNLSAVYGAACSRLPGMKKEGNPDLDGGGFAEDVIQGWVKRGQALKCDGGACKFAEVEGQMQMAESFVKGENPIFGFIQFQDELKKRGINGAAITVANLEREAASSAVPFDEKDYEIEILDQSKLRSHVPVCDPLNSDAKLALRLMTQQLCKGLPVVTALRMFDVETSKDGGKTWAPHAYNPNKHATHAMVATGIEWEGETPYIVFRNSWAEGSAENPHASKARLPFSAHCRILRASVLRGPADRASLENAASKKFVGDLVAPPRSHQ